MHRISSIYAIFFLSGISGLIYQLVWIREFGQVFGNTVHSAALVSGVFVFCLGLGAWLGGRYIDRRHSRDPLAGLRAYAVTEVLIGLAGLALAFLIPWMETISTAISWYVQDPQGWHELSAPSLLLRYLVAMALIGPISLLMGATLAMLIRFILGTELQAVGWRVGLLYGFNTAGAAIGCLLVDWIAVPALGLQSTKLLAVTLNLVAAAAAFGLLARLSPALGRRTVMTGGAAAVRPATGGAAGQRSRTHWIGLAVFLTGFAAMGMEIVWFRYLISLMGGYRIVFSVVLTVILLGMWCGSLGAGVLTRRYTGSGQQAWLFLIGVALFATSTLWLLFADTRDGLHIRLAVHAHQNIDQLTDIQIAFYELARYFLLAIKLLGIPAILMGVFYPLANSLVQTRLGDVGARAGTLYLWNALGALLGSLLAGFVILPALGMQGAAELLMGIALLACLPVAIFLRATGRAAGRPDRPWSAATALSGVLALGTLLAWHQLPDDHMLGRSFLVDPEQHMGQRTVAASEGVLENIVVTESPDGERALWTNGHSMSGTSPTSQRYMRAFVHLPLLQIDQPKKVLVICFGVGNTLHAASLHPSVERLEVADISRHVLEHAVHFETWNDGVLDDERVRVFVNDGRQHLRMSGEEQFDLITLEPPPLRFAGVSSLYSETFYQLAYRALKPGGFVTQWWPADQLGTLESLALVQAFVNVFPDAVIYNGAFVNFMLVGRREADNSIDPDQIARRLADRPRVAEDLERIDLSSLTEILGGFAGYPGPALARLGALPSITDDRPMMEYTRINRSNGRMPIELFGAAGFRRWCRDCFRDGKLRAELEDLPSYLKLSQLIYRSPDFFRVFSWSRARRVTLQDIEALREPAGNADVDFLPDALSRGVIENLSGRYGYLRAHKLDSSQMPSDESAVR